MSALRKVADDWMTAPSAGRQPVPELLHEIARFGDRAVLLRRQAEDWSRQKADLEALSDRQWESLERVRLAFDGLAYSPEALSILIDLIVFSQTEVATLEMEILVVKEIIEGLILDVVSDDRPEDWTRRALSHVLLPMQFKLDDRKAQLYSLMSIKAGYLPGTAPLGFIRREDRLESLLEQWPADDYSAEIRTGSAVGNEFA